MKRVSWISLITLLLVIVLAGCSSQEEKMINHIDNIAKILTSNKDNPDKVGDELQQYVNENKDEIKQLGEDLDKKTKKMSKEEKKKYDEKWQPRLEKPMKKILEAATNQKLMTNPKVQQAMKDLGNILPL